MVESDSNVNGTTTTFPISSLVGAVFRDMGSGFGGGFGSETDPHIDSQGYVEILALHPERHMRRRAAWMFRSSERARKFTHRINEVAASEGVKADVVLNSGFGNTVMVGDRVYVSRAKSTTNTRLTSTVEFAIGDVASVSMRRYRPKATSRITVRLSDGSVVRTWFEGPDLEKAEEFVERLADQPESATPGADHVSDLERLGEMYKEGLLTAEEFAAAKQRILRE